MQRIALISDTHVSPKHGFFVDNVLRTIDAIAAEQPDLVVHCGDLTINGADDERDLRFAAYVHERIDAPLAIVPGNHDIGEEPQALEIGQPISPERIERYRTIFGPDWWARDLGSWRLIGLNSLLIGSALAEESAQNDWLMQELVAARGRPIGIFLHKPLWIESPDEAGRPEAAIDPAQRNEYRAAFVANGVRFVASGHLHQSRRRLQEGMLHVWAPTCAFPVPHDLGGNSALGYAMLELRDDGGAAARFIAPSGLVRYDYEALKGHGAYRNLKDCPPSPPSIEWDG